MASSPVTPTDRRNSGGSRRLSGGGRRLSGWRAEDAENYIEENDDDKEREAAAEQRKAQLAKEKTKSPFRETPGLQKRLQVYKDCIEIAAADNSSMLVFSGGETRVAAGPRSEAASHWEAADALGWFGTPHVRERSLLEPHARDSLENLLFAICRFREASGRYPSRVTVVSFAFKRRRFVELHRAALRLPRSRQRPPRPPRGSNGPPGEPSNGPPQRVRRQSCASRGCASGRRSRASTPRRRGR